MWKPYSLVSLVVLAACTQPDAAPAAKAQVDAALASAEEALQMGDPSTAVMHLRAATAVEPQDVRLHLALARVYQRNGRAQDALAEYELLLSLGVRDDAVSIERATALAQCARYTEARTEFLRLRGATSTQAVAEYNLGLLAMQEGSVREALQYFEAVYAAQPAWAPVRRELARALLATSEVSASTAQRALDLLVTEADAHATDWRAWEAIGDAWTVLGDREAALQAYVEALRFGQNPASVEERYKRTVRTMRESTAQR